MVSKSIKSAVIVKSARPIYPADDPDSQNKQNTSPAAAVKIKSADAALSWIRATQIQTSKLLPIFSCEQVLSRKNK